MPWMLLHYVRPCMVAAEKSATRSLTVGLHMVTKQTELLVKQKRMQMSGIRARILLLAGFAIVLTTLVFQGQYFQAEPVFAAPDNPGYLAAANSKYPGISGTQLDSCTLCHTAIPNLNPYGTAFANIPTHGANPNQAFVDIELLDSDNDGFDNITEINALTFPGDPNSKPPVAETAIIVEKQTTPNNDPETFTFTGGINANLSDGQMAKEVVTPGQYSVVETVPISWTLSSIVCDDGNSTGDTGTATATFNVVEGQTVKCVFNNTNNNAPPESTIVIKKQTIPDGDTTPFAFTGAFDQSLTDGQMATTGVSAGQHSATETIPSGWTLSHIGCVDSNNSGDIGTATANFNVSSGDTATCIFTNTNHEAVIKDLDTTLGISGTVTTDIAATKDEGNGVAVQTDGKIVVAGTVADNGVNDDDFAVARYSTTGVLDTSFGAGGKVTTNISTTISGGSTDNGNGVAIQTDGKIVVAGRSDSLFALVRYNTDGTPDTGFGAGGIVTADFSSLGSSYKASSGNAVAIQPDGKIVVVGSVQNGSQYEDFGVMRFNTDGTLDTSFGTGGKMTTSVRVQEPDRAFAVAIQTDGKIIVVGETKSGQFRDGALRQQRRAGHELWNRIPYRRPGLC